MPDKADQTEKATPKRRQDARKKGQVAKSADLNGAVVLVAALGSLASAPVRPRGKYSLMVVPWPASL